MKNTIGIDFISLTGDSPKICINVTFCKGKLKVTNIVYQMSNKRYRSVKDQALVSLKE